MSIPAWKRPEWNDKGGATNKGEVPLWSGKGEPPEIGAVVKCSDRKGTEVRVLGYLVMEGWLMIDGLRLHDNQRGNLAGAEVHYDA